MRLNQTLGYGLACLSYLVEKRGVGWVEVREIAERQSLPAAYCHKVLQALSHAGIVDSVRGKGYRLARDPSEINVGEIMDAFANGGVARRSRPELDLEAYRSLQATLDGWLETISLTELIEKSRREKTAA